MLTDEEIQEIKKQTMAAERHPRLNQFARAIERTVLAKAMPIPKQEPVGVTGADGNLQTFGKRLPANTKIYAAQQPAQAAANPLVDAVFAASHKKATDTHGKCPHCSHECAQAAAIPEIATDEMCEALEQCLIDQGWDSDYVGEIDKAQCWSVMLEAASPNPPQSENHQVAQCCEIIRDLSSVIRSQINLGKLKGDDKYVVFGGSRGEISNLLGWADSILSASQKAE